MLGFAILLVHVKKFVFVWAHCQNEHRDDDERNYEGDSGKDEAEHPLAGRHEDDESSEYRKNRRKPENFCWARSVTLVWGNH